MPFKILTRTDEVPKNLYQFESEFSDHINDLARYNNEQISQTQKILRYYEYRQTPRNGK
jgi:hypothetical protein